MATPKQIAANRRNAEKSTGPKTEAGKLRSRLNALKHGLGAIHVPLPHEDSGEYTDILTGLTETYQPANTQEQMLVGNIASAWLRMQRAGRFEATLMNGEILNLKGKNGKSLEPDPDDDLGIIVGMANGNMEKAWMLLERYEKRAQSAYYRAIATLRTIQSDRRREASRQAGEEQASRKYLACTVAPLSPVPPPEMASFGTAKVLRSPAPEREVSASALPFATSGPARQRTARMPESSAATDWVSLRM